MNKKAYNVPTLKVVQLEEADLICQSQANKPTTFSLIDEEVQEQPQEPASSAIWGKQW